MKFNFKKPIFRMGFFIFLFGFCNCSLTIRVYIPASNLEKEIQVLENFKHSVESQLKETYFATSSLLVFFKSQHENEFGTLAELIKKKLHNDKYSNQEPLKIIIKNFRLETNDRCTSNLAEVNLEIDVLNQKNQNILNFTYKNEIHSYVTTCMNTLMTISVVGWLWYGPYVGFRGNREDQINQLGRLSLLEFFENLDLAIKNLKPVPKKVK